MAEFRTLGISAAALALVAVCAIALGQSTQTDHSAMHHGDVSDDSSPKLPGQDAFGAMQEIVAILEADPVTVEQGRSRWAARAPD